MPADPDPSDPSHPVPPPLGAGITIVAEAATARLGRYGGGQVHGPIHTHCENCGTELLGPYCHRCGQHDFPVHTSFSHLVQEALENFFHFEGKFFRNVVTLLFRPGELTAEFNRGRRASQMPPFRLYLFVSLLFFVALFGGGGHPPAQPVTKEDAAEAKAQISEALAIAATATAEPARREALERAGAALHESNPIGGPAQAESRPGAAKPRVAASARRLPGMLERLLERMMNAEFRARMFEEFTHAMPRLLLLALPLFALYTRLLFRAAGQVYLQHLVVSLHFHTFVYLWMMLRDGWTAVAGLGSPALASGIHSLCDLWLLVYPIWMLQRLFANAWWKTILKAVVLNLAYSVTLGAIFLSGFFVLIAYDAG